MPPSVALAQCFLHVTEAYNLHCAYCYFSAAKPRAALSLIEEHGAARLSKKELYSLYCRADDLSGLTIPKIASRFGW